MVNFMLNDLGSPSAEVFDALLEFFILPFHLDVFHRLVLRTPVRERQPSSV